MKRSLKYLSHRFAYKLFRKSVSLIVFILFFFCLPAGSDEGTKAWTVVHGNQQLSGCSQIEVNLPLLPAWEYNATDIIKSSPVISSGKVFIGCNDGFLYALDLLSGKLAWKQDAGAPVEAPPLFAFNSLFVAALDGRLWCLDPEDGTKRWAFDAKGKITGSPNWFELYGGSKQRIVFGSYDKCVYSVDAGTGKKIWSFEADSFINGAPSLYHDSIIFAGCDARVRLLKNNSGQELFQFDTGSYIPGSVAIAGNYAITANYNGSILCINLEKKIKVWEYENSRDNSSFYSTPAVDSQLVLAGDNCGTLYCLDLKTGKLKWTFRTEGEFSGSPLIAGDKALILPGDGFFRVLSLKTGKELWSYAIGGGFSTGTPAIVRLTAGSRVIVIVCADSMVYAFTAKPIPR